MNLMIDKTISNLNFSILESKAGITHDKLPTVFADPDQMVRVF